MNAFLDLQYSDSNTITNRTKKNDGYNGNVYLLLAAKNKSEKESKRPRPPKRMDLVTSNHVLKT